MTDLAANKRTLLEIVQEVCDSIALPRPNTVIGNTDAITRQLLSLAQMEAREFSLLGQRQGGWQELRQEYNFTTSAITGLTGDTTAGSPIMTNISSTAGVTAGMVAVNSGLQWATTVLSVDSPTQVTLNVDAVSTTVGQTLYFSVDNYAFPTDIAYFQDATYWDRAFRWQLLGPLSAQEWQVLKSGISPVGPRRRFRIMNNRFYLDPPPSSSDNVEVFEYFSFNWAQSSVGVGQAKFLADSDYYVLDDFCLEQGIKWRFLRAKGLDYSEEKRTYDFAVERAMARNGGARSLPLNSAAAPLGLIGPANIPDTGFGT